MTHTHILFILDRSGSMASLWSEAKDSFGRFVEDQKKATGTADISLVVFNYDYEVVHWGVPLEESPGMPETITPAGLTALNDAYALAIDQHGERLAALDEQERGKTIVVTMTDGHENASREYTRAEVAARIKHQQERYGWEFVFLGANQDAPEVAMGYNIPQANAMTWEATALGYARATNFASSLTSKVRKGTSASALIAHGDDEEPGSPSVS